MATHSSTLAWKIPWTEEPGKLQSMGSQSRTLLSDFSFFLSFFLSRVRSMLWGLVACSSLVTKTVCLEVLPM